MRETSALERAAFFAAMVALHATYSFAEAVVRDLGVTEIAVDDSDSPNPYRSEDFVQIESSAWEGKNISAATLLAELPGITAQKQGGMGAFQTLSIRGNSPKSTLICINGIPYENVGGGAFDLATIDLNNVEKIQVHKQGRPTINFIMKNSATKKGRVMASYGSHNTKTLSTQISSPLDLGVAFSTSVSYRHSDNDYKFLNRNGTEYNTQDDFWSNRKNAAYTSISGSHTLYKIFSNNFLASLGVSHSTEWGGNPGRESNQTVVAGFHRDFIQTDLQVESPTFLTRFLLQSQTTGRFEKSTSHSFYPLDKIGYRSDKYMEYGAASYTLGEIITLSLTGYPVEGCVKVGTDFQNTTPRDNNRLSSAYSWELNRIEARISPQATIHFNHFFRLNTQAQGEFIYDEKESGTLYMPNTNSKVPHESSSTKLWSLKGKVEAGKKESLVKASLSLDRYYRAPQPMELYGVYRGMVSNPDLKEETGYGTDFSIAAQSPSRKTTVTASLFGTWSSDQIIWVTYESITRPYNLSKSRTLGAEISMNSQLVHFASIHTNATFQKPQDLTSGVYHKNQLAEEPEQSYFASLTFYFPLNLEFTMEANARSKIYKDRANREKIPPQSFYNASLAIQPHNNVKLTLSINNITDEDYQNIYSAYPMPGRELFGAVEIHF